MMRATSALVQLSFVIWFIQAGRVGHYVNGFLYAFLVETGSGMIGTWEDKHQHYRRRHN